MPGVFEDHVPRVQHSEIMAARQRRESRPAGLPVPPRALECRGVDVQGDPHVRMAKVVGHVAWRCTRGDQQRRAGVPQQVGGDRVAELVEARGTDGRAPGVSPRWPAICRPAVARWCWSGSSGSGVGVRCAQHLVRAVGGGPAEGGADRTSPGSRPAGWSAKTVSTSLPWPAIPASAGRRSCGPCGSTAAHPGLPVAAHLLWPHTWRREHDHVCR